MSLYLPHVDIEARDVMSFAQLYRKLLALPCKLQEILETQKEIAATRKHMGSGKKEKQNMDIIVHSITPVNGQGNLIAVADVTAFGERNARWRIVKEESKRAWVQPPQLTWTYPGSDELCYRPAIEITSAQREAVQALVLAAWAEQEGAANE